MLQANYQHTNIIPQLAYFVKFMFVVVGTSVRGLLRWVWVYIGELLGVR